MNTLLTALQNKHTTGAGIAYLLLKTLTQILSVWMPEYHDKLATTSEILEGAAVAYGLIAAGDASKSKAQLQSAVDDLGRKTAEAIETKDTSHLVKPDITNIVPGKPNNPS